MFISPIICAVVAADAGIIAIGLVALDALSRP